jgi:hypothetical protein
MRPVQTMLLLAALLLSFAVRAEEPEGAGGVRVAVRDALAEKATLPALRPSLPSLLADRDGPGFGARNDGGEAAQEARGEAERSAGREQANAHSAAARKEAAAAAADAAGDEHGASEQARVQRAKKEHVKPPNPVKPEKLRP